MGNTTDHPEGNMASTTTTDYTRMTYTDIEEAVRVALGLDQGAWAIARTAPKAKMLMGALRDATTAAAALARTCRAARQELEDVAALAADGSTASDCGYIARIPEQKANFARLQATYAAMLRMALAG